MTTRFVETEHDRKMLITFLGNQDLPFSVNLTKGHLRSTKQNRLQRLWVNEIAEQMSQHTAEQWRGYCKLHFGVPILRNENEAFQQQYDLIVEPLPYEHKLLAMQVPLDLPVTSIMNSKQKKSYLDAVYAHFSEQGVVLTDPDPFVYGRAA